MDVVIKRKGFYNAIQKYGWDNFEHEIIAEHLTEEEACNMEIALIKALNSDGENGYNNHCGGHYKYLGLKVPLIILMTSPIL